MIIRHVKILLHGVYLDLWKNIVDCFRGRNILYHIAGIFISIVLILSGIDWAYFVFFRDHLFLQVFFFIALPLGGFLPFIIPLYLYRKSLKKKRPEFKNVTIALLQASLIALIIISAYKGITGRPPPELIENDDEGRFFSEIFNGDDDNKSSNAGNATNSTQIGNETGRDEDYSREFRFGLLRGGIFHGWPSGHTTTAFAMVFTLINMYPKHKRIRKYGIIYASYIGIGVSTNVHWLSDSVAAVFVGIVIGTVVGNNFRKQNDLVSPPI